VSEDFGLLWPACDGEDLPPRLHRISAARQATTQIAGMATQHRVCVQAGGHIGLWPRSLATVFETVYTFEPDAANWACLVENVTAPNVFAARGVLGAQPGGVSLTRSKEKSGLWRTVPGGPIPTYTVDSLGLTTLDALVLDVEGDEWAVIQGASKTLARCHPVVWFEARLAHTASVIERLMVLGYSAPQRALGRDLVMVHESEVAA
jgi:FkbM family methyltransferase